MPEKELGDRQGEATTWDSLGVAYHQLGRYAAAVAAYQRALELLRDLGHQPAVTAGMVPPAVTTAAAAAGVPDPGRANRWRSS